MRLRLTDMAYGGDAVGRDPDSGMAIFAWPGITGEEVDVEVHSRREKLARGLVTSVLEPSNVRVEPQCPYFGECGGCQWQHIDYGAPGGQVAFKNSILADQLSRHGGVANVEQLLKPPVPSPRDYGYRNTSHFAVDPQSRKLAYSRRGSHSLIAVDTCPISNAGINALIPRVNALLSSARSAEELQYEPRGLMHVWNVAIRSSEALGYSIIVLHTRPGGQAQARPGRERMARGGQHQGDRPDSGPSPDVESTDPVITLRRRDVKRAVPDLARVEGRVEPLALVVIEVMDDGTVNMLGEAGAAGALSSDAVADALTGALISEKPGRWQGRGGNPSAAAVGPVIGSWVERLAGRNFWVGPEAFFQVNSAAAENLLAEVRDNVPSGLGLILDAHAGVGTFALSLADRAKRVIAFEIDRASVDSARWTARAGSIANVDFRVGKAEMLVGRMAEGDRPDLVLLDPPRSGCHHTLLRRIQEMKVKRVVYVSCDPSTLARDVRMMAGSYRLSSARMIDMFPQTYHLETVAVLDLMDAEEPDGA